MYLTYLAAAACMRLPGLDIDGPPVVGSTESLWVGPLKLTKLRTFKEGKVAKTVNYIYIKFLFQRCILAVYTKTAKFLFQRCILALYTKTAKFLYQRCILALYTNTCEVQTPKMYPSPVYQYMNVQTPKI